jgi:hypothetical protein
MALWQFTVLAALIGILLVHAIVLSIRIGRTNAALKRIEELLLARTALAVPASSVEAEAMQTEEAAQAAGVGQSVGVGQAVEVGQSVGVEQTSEAAAALSDTGRLKTLRDLRSASAGRPDSQSSFAMNPASRVERRRRARLLSLPAAPAGGEDENGTPVAELPPMHANHGDTDTSSTASFEIHDAPDTSDELPSVHAEQGETADLPASTLEDHGAINTAPDLPAMHADRRENEAAAAAGFEFYGVPDTMVELSGVQAGPGASESPSESAPATFEFHESTVAANSESSDTANASAENEQPDSSATAPAEEDSAAEKQARDTLFMLHRQRRRRRERQGF